MAGLNVVSFRPERSDYAWTFGGVDPVMKVKPGDVLEIWTDDCFGGLVESVDDLPSKKITAFNPQTGPFYVEGAEPGDTLALHFVSIEPSRDWAVSTTFPLFGALTSTTRTVTLQDPLPELVWRYDVDRERRIFSEQAAASGKPANIVEKMVQGRVDKYYKEVTLLDQPWVRDDSKAIRDLVKAAGAGVSIRRFARFQIGQE